MTRYYLGQPFREELTVRDVGGSLVDPTTVSLSFRYPDGEITPGPVPVRDSLGHYHADVTLPVVGRYRRVWTTTGPGAGTDVADVTMVDPYGFELVSLGQVKSYLNIDEDNTTHDEELTDFVDSLPDPMEYLAGPILPVERTELLIGAAVLVVARPPIAEVISVTPYLGSPVDLLTLDIDNRAGMIRYTTGIHPGRVTVVYVSGYQSVPAPINLAARVITEHWWNSQRATATSRRDRRDDVDTSTVPGFGFAIPRYAAELLVPFNPDTGLS